MSNSRAIQRIRSAFREVASALEELIDEDDWIDQKSSPLGRRAHCEAARSGELQAKKHKGKWLARRADVDAYIEKHGTRPPADRPGVDDEATKAAILQFRAPKRLKRSQGEG